MIRPAIGLLTIALLSGCTAARDRPCPTGTKPVTVYTLFFGRSIDGRPDLTETEWRRFVETEVAVAIPDGWTDYDAAGGWWDPAARRTILENSKVLITALPETPDSAARITRLRAAYQTAFKQKLVGVTVAPACGAF